MRPKSPRDAGIEMTSRGCHLTFAKGERRSLFFWCRSLVNWNPALLVGFKHSVVATRTQKCAKASCVFYRFFITLKTCIFQYIYSTPTKGLNFRIIQQRLTNRININERPNNSTLIYAYITDSARFRHKSSLSSLPRSLCVNNHVPERSLFI